MFLSSEQRHLDPKGRLMIPPEYREVAKDMGSEDGLVLTTFDGCVGGYPEPEWNKIAKSFLNVNVLDPVMRDLQRYFLSSARKVSFDKQGRLLIPSYHREYAGLEKDVVIAGVGIKLEIWDKDTYMSRLSQTEASMSEKLSGLADKGISLRF